MRICIFILGVLLISGVSFAADIDGSWSGEIDNPFATMGRGMGGGMGGGMQQPAKLQRNFTFKADGETLTGSYHGTYGQQVNIREGIIKGKKIWFLVESDYMGSKMTTRYKGKIKGNKIKLTYKTVTENQAPGGFSMGDQPLTVKRVGQ